MRHVVVALVCGCGRIDFAERVDGGLPANAVTVTFGETGSATFSGVTRDTYLDVRAPDANWGAFNELKVDPVNNVSLIRFDVAAIPTTATVVQASLRLATGNDISPNTIEIRALREAWDEGSGSSSAGDPGVASYTNRQLATPWSAPGASGASRDPAVLGTFRATATTTMFEASLTPSAVGGWVADPASNLGVVVSMLPDMDPTDGCTLRARENGMPSLGPLLKIVYLP
jgi:hypothetical protein